MSTPSLYTLPIELLHGILDHVDTETVFFSFRIVCKYFHTIINSYNQHKLDFRSITKPAFHRVRHFIQPENVVSLILSNDYRTCGQITLFLSLFNIEKFTRLRSLTLIQIDNADLMVYLKHISACPLVSLNIVKRKRWTASTPFETTQLMMQYPIRHLKLTQYSSLEAILYILHHSSSLETLLLDGFIKLDAENDPADLIVVKSKLKSLTVDTYSPNMKTIVSILSCTPSLTRLKLTRCPTVSGLAWDGYWWTEFIQKNLCQLQFFEFFFEKRIDHRESTCDIQSIIMPFRTSFWLEKRWYVTCDYYTHTHELTLYSIPICKSTIVYRPTTTNKISCSNFINDSLYIMDNVCSLLLNSIPSTVDTCDSNLLSNGPLFSRVTKLTLVITNNFSDGSIEYLSNLVDLSHVDTFSLTLDLCERSLNAIRTVLNNLFARTCNFQTIHLHSTRANKPVEYLTVICPMIPNRVKNLLIDVENQREMPWILDRLENFSSITFQAKNYFGPFFNQIIDILTKNGKDYIHYKDPLCISFWFGKQK